MPPLDKSKQLHEHEAVSSELIDEVLGDEYEHERVPIHARHSTFSVSTVWIGFPMILTGAMTGSLMVAGMGFQKALWAMIIGNLLMFAYVGALGVLGTSKGMNFGLLATIVFGRKGCVIASGLLSTLLLGWYAVQTGITGNLIHAAYNVNYLLMTIIAGLLYLAITFVGIRGLHWIGIVSVPLFMVLGTWVAFDSASHAGWSAVFSYAGANHDVPMAFGIGLTMVITLFIDAGTVAADFNRWSKDTKSSLIATFSAFPFANMYAMLVGGVMTAALALPNPQPFASDNMFGYLLTQNLPWLSVLAFVFVLCNLGSVCSHCLYNSAVGWSRIAKSKMRVFAVLLAIIGIAIAAANVWAMFVPWLSLLGILVPPIGAIIIVDQYMTRPDAESERERDWRGTAFAAWIIGSLAAFFIEKAAPELSTAVSAFVVAGIAYALISALERSRQPAAQGRY